MTRCLWQLVYSHFKLLFYHTADFDAVGQCASECVQTRGEMAEVDGGLVLECGHAATSVVEDVDTFNLAVSLDSNHAGSRVGEDGHPLLGERLIVGDVVSVALKSFGCREAERDVVDVVPTVVVRIARCEDVLESDVVSVTGVGGEVDRDVGDGGGGVVDGGDGHE